ncbi:hypothetical protein VAE130_550176 [Vibrio aestuarianus]|nr:hypothetical protein VAE130_550176 [Vibrio aestuarianus]CAH8194914.1 hypothetical protein VAE016_350176 [Vibrio aestuarianus]
MSAFLFVGTLPLNSSISSKPLKQEDIRVNNRTAYKMTHLSNSYPTQSYLYTFNLKSKQKQSKLLLKTDHTFKLN